MNCNTFRKYKNEYMDNELFMEVREAMNDHLKGCKECRELYNEELYIDRLLKSALVEENISFRSSRSEIISSIDKKRYSKSPINKLKFSLVKNKMRLSAGLLAACFLLFLLNSNFMDFNIPLDGGSSDKSSAGAYRNNDDAYKMEGASIEDESQFAAEINDEKFKATENSYEAFIKKIIENTEPYRSAGNTVKFTVKQRTENELYNNPSSWKNTSDNKYSALLDGKGELLNKEGIIDGYREEGSTVIVVKNNETKEAVNITLDSKDKQHTPLYIEWTEDGKLLVIVGLAYGTVVRGGDVYLLDTETASSILIYKADISIGEEAAVLETKDEFLAIYLMKYLDDNKTTGTVEDIALMFDQVTEENIHSTDEALIELISTFNTKEAKKAEENFLMDYSSYNLEELGHISGIESSKLISLRRINNFYDEIVKKDYGIDDVATYLVEMDFKLQKAYDGPLKEGISYQAVTIVKPSGEESYKIADIFIIPSN